MPDDSPKSTKRILDPIDRISEVLFGLIMVLTFTGSLSIAESGHVELRTMLIAALGCNLAWGIIDGVLYLMGCMAEQARSLRAWRAVRSRADPHEAQQLVAAALPPIIASVLQPAELAAVCQRLQELPEPHQRAHPNAQALKGALGVFLLVFGSILPVILPFLLMHNAMRALRVSNTIAVAMLFLTGYVFGRITGQRRWLAGIAMVVLGCVLVGMTMALGG